MVEMEMLRKIEDRYAAHGTIPAAELANALADVEGTIEDFERSPTGPSSRNAAVLAIVRRTCTDPLRGMARRIRLARNSGAGLAVEELRSA
jgi:hypothetical protein